MAREKIVMRALSQCKGTNKLWRSYAQFSRRLICSYVKNYSQEHLKRSKQVVALINIAQTSDLIAQKSQLPDTPLPPSGLEENVGTLFIFGLGYVGLGLATQLRSKGWYVSPL